MLGSVPQFAIESFIFLVIHNINNKTMLTLRRSHEHNIYNVVLFEYA